MDLVHIDARLKTLKRRRLRNQLLSYGQTDKLTTVTLSCMLAEGQLQLGLQVLPMQQLQLDYIASSLLTTAAAGLQDCVQILCQVNTITREKYMYSIQT